jgi:flagellin-specific chaperone FliS
MFRIRPEIANRRKREHTLEEATEICALYNELSRILSINTINAEKEIDEVQEVIQRLCNKNFHLELKRQHQK